MSRREQECFMGARVVTLDAGYWASEKPPDYKNNTLDKALSTFQGLEDDAKKTKIPLKMEFEPKLTMSNLDAGRCAPRLPSSPEAYASGRPTRLRRSFITRSRSALI